MKIEIIDESHMTEATEVAINDIIRPESDAQIRKNGIKASQVNSVRQSIEKHGGLKKPIVLEKDEDGNDKLVVGNHRLEAYEQLGKETIPAIYRSFSSSAERRLFQAKENDHDPSFSNTDGDLKKLIETLVNERVSAKRLNLKDSKSREAAKKDIAKKVHTVCDNNFSETSVETLVKNYFKNSIPEDLQGFKNWTKRAAFAAAKSFLGWKCTEPVKSGKVFEDAQGNSHVMYITDPRNENIDVFYAYAARKKRDNPNLNVVLVATFDSEKIQYQKLSGFDSLSYRRGVARTKLAEMNEVKIFHPIAKSKMVVFDEFYFMPQLKDGINKENLSTLIKQKV